MCKDQKDDVVLEEGMRQLFDNNDNEDMIRKGENDQIRGKGCGDDNNEEGSDKEGQWLSGSSERETNKSLIKWIGERYLQAM